MNTEIPENVINVYDSRLPSIGSNAASILACNEKQINIHMMDVQRQKGTCECGFLL